MEPVAFSLCGWSEIKVASTDYAIQIVECNIADRLTCWLSDFSTLWHETIKLNDVAKRYEECNPLLNFQNKNELIFWKYTSHPEDANQLSIVEQNDDMLKLSTKNFISDGSDDIPLKFYWSLEKVCDPAIYGKFTRSVLKDIISLQKLRKYEMKRKNTDKEDVGNDSSTSFIHPLIDQVYTCNNCNEVIFGTRYHCLDCRDYDLCGDCPNIKHEHIMVRYARPEDESRFKRSYKRSPLANLWFNKDRKP